jgi:RNA polymerase sigma-70 factor (ECF subfamily)
MVRHQNGVSPSPDQPLSDSELVSKARNNADAFTVLYQRYVTRVYRYFLSHVADAADAEDLTSKTFIAVLQGLNGFNGKSNFSTWLFGIASHKLLDHFRSRPLIQSLESQPEDGLITDSNALSLEVELQLEEVLAALKLIGGDRAQVIALRVFADLSVAETAAVMSRSEDAVYALMSRAVRDLRQLLVKGETHEPRR